MSIGFKIPDRVMLGGVEWMATRADYTSMFANPNSALQEILCTMWLDRVYQLDPTAMRRSFSVHDLPTHIDFDTGTWFVQDAQFTETYRARGYHQSELRLTLIHTPEALPKNWPELVVDEDDSNVG